MAVMRPLTASELPPCSVETTLTLISNKWRVMIVRELLGGPLRFTELKTQVGGISQKVLTANLRAMETDRLLTRTVHAEVPPRVVYQLTELGESLAPVLDALRDWGDQYKRQLAAAAPWDAVFSPPVIE